MKSLPPVQRPSLRPLLLASLIFCAPAGNAEPLSSGEPVASNGSQAGCSLHVWPGSNLRSTYWGWAHGAIVDGAVTGRDGYRKLPAGPLDTDRQREILSGTDVAKALGLAGYRVAVHDEALDSRTLRSTPGSWLAATTGTPPSACQAELAIDDVFYQEDIVSGRYLKVIYRFKRFGEGDGGARSFGQIMAVKLSVFPPAPGTDPTPALEELGSALARSLDDFGASLNAPVKKRR